MPPLTQAWQVFHSLLTPLYFVYGRSGLRPSLVQGLRPRNAPVQNQSRRGASVCVIAPITPRQPITRREYQLSAISGEWQVTCSRPATWRPLLITNH